MLFPPIRLRGPLARVRRRQILLAAGALLATPFASGQRRFRVAVLAASTRSGARHLMQAFASQLEVLGWRDDQNVAIDYRYADGDMKRLGTHAAEIVAERPDLIFAPPEPAALEVRRLTKEIPIVFAIASDPVGSGLAASLSRPGGNATGLTNLNVELSAKRLQLLKQVSPAIERVAVLVNSNVKNTLLQFDLARRAGEQLGLNLLMVDVLSQAGLERGFDDMLAKRVHGLVILADPLLFTQRQWIAERARRARLISISAFAEYPDAGGLASYAVDFPAQFRRAAAIVDKILKGAKPADLPIEQAAQLELVINRKTASALGLTIPQSILLRADRLID